MRLLFKNLYTTNLKEALAYFDPFIRRMEEDDIDQFGFNGREDLDDIDYGEGKTRSGVPLDAWNIWRDESYNTGWMRSFLEKLPFKEYGRIRLMKLKPHRCYSWHTDITPRVHVPLITCKENLMVIDTQVKYLIPGFVWWTDTRVHHTALNGSEVNRYHLVVEVAPDEQ